jgi:hypothetical protein
MSATVAFRAKLDAPEVSYYRSLPSPYYFSHCTSSGTCGVGYIPLSVSNCTGGEQLECVSGEAVGWFNTNNQRIPSLSGGAPTFSLPSDSGIIDVNNYKPQNQPDVLVHYPAASFQTAEDVQLFQATIANGTSGGFVSQAAYDTGHKTDRTSVDPGVAVSALMSPFCQQVVGTCPDGGASCSRFSSTGADGTICSNWAIGSYRIASQSNGQNQTGANAASAAMTAYCNANTVGGIGPEECRCIKAVDLDPLVRILADISGTGKANLPTAFGCWYLPCQLPDQYLVSYDYWSQSNTPGVCPAQICEDVLNIVQGSGGTININDFTQITSCSTKPGPPGPPTPGGGGLWQSIIEFLEDYKWILIGIAIGLFLLIIVFIVIGHGKGREKGKPQPAKSKGGR